MLAEFSIVEMNGGASDMNFYVYTDLPVSGETKYLHGDGTLHDATYSDKNKDIFPGWYADIENAFDAIRVYRSLNT